jgi:antitoxin PrlF
MLKCKYFMGKKYKLKYTQIGNSKGFRIPAEFYRDRPEFAADGWVEVVSDNTAIIRVEPTIADADANEEDELMMRLFLDFALSESLKQGDLLHAYTVEEAASDMELIAGVELDNGA